MSTSSEIVYTPIAIKPRTPRAGNKRGRKTDLERITTKHETERETLRLERIAEVESKRARPLLPDTKLSLMVAVGLVSVLMLSSFTVSFAGIYQVSSYTGLPAFLQWLPALFIDLAILAYTVSLIIFKSRGSSTWRTMLGLGAFAALSVSANVVHTLAFWNGALSDYRAWIGVIITAAAPIAVLLASEEISRLAFVEPLATK